MNPRRLLLLVTAGGLVLLLAAVLLSLHLAPEGLGLEALREGAPERARLFLLEVRLPRVLLGLAVGAGLAVSGAALQALLRNPLADPYVLGISGGAAVGGALALVLARGVDVAPLLGGYATRCLGALAGAACAIVFIARVVLSGRLRSVHGIILAGIALNIAASAVITVIQTLSAPQDAQALLFWLVGSLSELPPGVALPLVASGVVVLAAAALIRSARALNILGLGEEAASGAGVHPRALLVAVLVATAAIAGISAALAGLIGFVGLVVPHLLRLIVGSDNRVLLPASALVGATLLLLCDTLSRVLFTRVGTELPVGVLTALVGAPLLIFLLVRKGPAHHV